MDNPFKVLDDNCTKLYVVMDIICGYPEEFYYSYDEIDAKSQAHIAWNDLDEASKADRKIKVYAYDVGDMSTEGDPEEVYWSYVVDNVYESDLVLEIR